MSRIHLALSEQEWHFVLQLLESEEISSERADRERYEYCRGIRVGLERQKSWASRYRKLTPTETCLIRKGVNGFPLLESGGETLDELEHLRQTLDEAETIYVKQERP